MTADSLVQRIVAGQPYRLVLATISRARLCCSRQRLQFTKRPDYEAANRFLVKARASTANVGSTLGSI